jgi:hypothetical protein
VRRGVRRPAATARRAKGTAFARKCHELVLLAPYLTGRGMAFIPARLSLAITTVSQKAESRMIVGYPGCSGNVQIRLKSA